MAHNVYWLCHVFLIVQGIMIRHRFVFLHRFIYGIFIFVYLYCKSLSSYLLYTSTWHPTRWQRNCDLVSCYWSMLGLFCEGCMHMLVYKYFMQSRSHNHLSTIPVSIIAVVPTVLCYQYPRPEFKTSICYFVMLSTKLCFSQVSKFNLVPSLGRCYVMQYKPLICPTEVFNILMTFIEKNIVV